MRRLLSQHPMASHLPLADVKLISTAYGLEISANNDRVYLRRDRDLCSSASDAPAVGLTR